MYSRELSKYIYNISQFQPVLVLTGARQTGKTTLLRDVFRDYEYLSFDDQTLASQAEENPHQFFKEHLGRLLIDEIQYAPKIFRHLKMQVDNNRHEMGRFILTGSQKFALMQGVSESLAGRAAVLELEGLSWKESRPAYANYDIPDFIWRGGFPELARLQDLNREVFYSSYLITYLERDVRQIVNVGSLRDFDRFVRLLATRNGQQLDMTHIANAVGVSSKTIGSWVSVMEAGGQISLLEPWFVNLGKRIVKTPKVYFNDTGFLTFLLGLSREAMARSQVWGQIWETFVYAELRKVLARNRPGQKIYYYRDNQGLEVDFLIPGGDCIAIEAKANEIVSPSDLSNLTKFTRLSKLSGEASVSSLDLVCISNAKNSHALEDGDQNKIKIVAGGEISAVF